MVGSGTPGTVRATSQRRVSGSCAAVRAIRFQAELCEQFGLVVVQVGADDLALVELEYGTERRVHRPASGGDLTSWATEGPGVRAGEAAFVHPAPGVGVDGGDFQPVVGERLVPRGPNRVGGVLPEQPTRFGPRGTRRSPTTGWK